MTGGDDGNGHLVIPLPGVKPEFGSQCGGPLASRDGWPRLPQPDPGETVAAFIDRAIDGDPFLQTVMVRTFQGPVSPLAVVRPAERTLGWWVEEWPYKEPPVFRWPGEAELPRSYHRDRVYWRLVVELFARWEAGDLVVKARRLDDPTSEVEVVELGLLRNPFMVLRPHHWGGGWFWP